MNIFKINTSKKFDLIRGLNIVNLKERHKLSIKNLKKGSYIKLGNDVLYVEDVYTYTEKGGEWKEYKLINVMTLKVSFIEVEEDDYLVVTLSETEIKMRNLGVSIDDIEDMSEDEEGQIKVNGKIYYYEDDYKAKFSRENSDKKEKVYFYDFEAEDGTLLTIEEWGSDKKGYDYEAWLSKEIPESSIEILAL